MNPYKKGDFRLSQKPDDRPWVLKSIGRRKESIAEVTFEWQPLYQQFKLRGSGGVAVYENWQARSVWESIVDGEEKELSKYNSCNRETYSRYKPRMKRFCSRMETLDRQKAPGPVKSRLHEKLKHRPRKISRKSGTYSFPDSVIINGRQCVEYLQHNPVYLSYLRAPFCLRKGQLCTDKEDISGSLNFHAGFQDVSDPNDNFVLTGIKIKVRGGGLKGQVQAMQLGIARGLLKIFSLHFGFPGRVHNDNGTFVRSAFGLACYDQRGRVSSRTAEAEMNIAMLRKSEFLTRDSRCKERKKYGLKKARKASQYS